MGDAGLAFVEDLARQGAPFVVPTTTNSRNVDFAKGGFATSWALLNLKARGLAPVAMLFGWASPVMVQGAVLAGVALMDRLTPDPMEAIRTGDWVRVDPKGGRVEVRRRP